MVLKCKINNKISDVDFSMEDEGIVNIDNTIFRVIRQDKKGNNYILLGGKKLYIDNLKKQAVS